MTAGQQPAAAGVVMRVEELTTTKILIRWIQSVTSTRDDAFLGLFFWVLWPPSSKLSVEVDWEDNKAVVVVVVEQRLPEDENGDTGNDKDAKVTSRAAFADRWDGDGAILLVPARVVLDDVEGIMNGGLRVPITEDSSDGLAPP